jgi:hypothetical protein
MDRKQETKEVKRALIAAGFNNNNLQVHHGKGTAWGWLHVHADIMRSPECYCGNPDEYGRRETCQPCKDWWSKAHNRIEEVTLAASDRKGLYQENVCIHLGFKETITLKSRCPIG